MSTPKELNGSLLTELLSIGKKNIKENINNHNGLNKYKKFITLFPLGYLDKSNACKIKNITIIEIPIK